MTKVVLNCPPSLGPPSGCGGGESPRPHWWKGAVAGCMRLYWKRNLCCSNSFFCCSLDCQDVLNISVLWAWCFNKKKIICATAPSVCPSFGDFIRRCCVIKSATYEGKKWGNVPGKLLQDKQCSVELLLEFKWLHLGQELINETRSTSAPNAQRWSTGSNKNINE